MRRFSTIIILLCCWAGLSFAAVPGAHTGRASRVIATVGDQNIYFGQIERMINSSVMIGVTLPPPGTRARNTLRLGILDKVISANLLYLDGLQRGMDNNPVYQHDVERFSDAMLASLYKEKHLVGDIQVSDKEVMDYYHKNIKTGTPFDKNVGTAIQATLRKQKFKNKIAGLRQQLRKGIQVSINKEMLQSDHVNDNKPTDIIAHIDAATLTWGDINRSFLSSHTLDKRLNILNRLIDTRIMTKKARQVGMEKDPVYQARVAEFRKARLINLRRTALDNEMEPDKSALRRYFEKNRDKISVKAHRKIQMVVLKTEQQAREVKRKIEAGDITIFEAAKQYSIAPNAKKTLGEVGWVKQGSGFPELSKLTFSLPVNKLGGPVKSPAGWHLVKVVATQDAAYSDINDKGTIKRARRLYLHEQQRNYVVGLRKHDFPVKVYGDVINQILQQEANTATGVKPATPADTTPAHASQPSGKAIAATTAG